MKHEGQSWSWQELGEIKFSLSRQSPRWQRVLKCSRYQFSFQPELLPSSTVQWLKHWPPVPRVAGSILPGPPVVYCSFGCNKPAECYFQFVIITSEYCTVLYCTVLYCTVIHVLYILMLSRYFTILWTEGMLVQPTVCDGHSIVVITLAVMGSTVLK